MHREMNQAMHNVARLKDVLDESVNIGEKHKQNCNTIKYCEYYIWDKYKHKKKLVENYSAI